MADISIVVEDCMDDKESYEQEGSPSSGSDGENNTPLLRIKMFAHSENVYSRQRVSIVLMELFKLAPADALTADLPEIMEVLSKLLDDENTPVQTNLLSHIGSIGLMAKECSKRVPALTNIVSEYMIQWVVRILVSTKSMLSKVANKVLFDLIEKGLVSKAQAEIQVCPTILALSRDECLNNYHTDAIILMSKMVSLLGRDVTERVFLDRFLELCTNKMVSVRRACASQFGHFCVAVGKQSFEKLLLPAYLKLCEDEVWGVRKGCAEVAISIACNCDPVTRRTVLAPVFVQFLQDVSRWVRTSAYKSLGPFISTFADPATTKLSYNNSGELVLINCDGSEFKLKSDVDTLTDEYVQWFIGTEPEWVGGKAIGMMFLNNQDGELNPELLGESRDIDEIGDFNEMFPDDCDELKNSDLLGGNKPYYTSWIFRPSNTEVKDNENSNESSKEEIPRENESLKIEESGTSTITEAQIDNKSDIKMHGDITLESADDNTKFVSRLLTIMKLDSTYPEENTLVECGNGDNGKTSIEALDNKTTNEGKDEESLELYNSHNYWYVPPDMPLDPSIIDAGLSSPKILNLDTLQTHKANELSNTPNCCEASENTSDVKTEDNTPSSNIEENSGQVTSNDIEKQDQTKPVAEKVPPQNIVPQLLIDHYISMTTPFTELNTEDSIAYHCAYSLPAVAVTLGPSNFHLLLYTVAKLAGDVQYKVRRTLASSLHELAKILGPDMASKILAPFFKLYIKDLDEVRIVVLKNLAEFLTLISPVKRRQFLPLLSMFLRNQHELNWRFRHEFAEQLRMVVTLFPPAEASKHISIIAQALLCDKVSVVREVAIHLVCDLLKHIGSDPGLTPMQLIQYAEKFAHSKKWKLRQTFVLLSAEMLVSEALPLDQFSSEVMPHLLDLSWDPVANVRLVVGRTITQHMITNEYFMDPENQLSDCLHSVLNRLQNDKDTDVKHSVKANHTNSIH